MNKLRICAIVLIVGAIAGCENMKVVGTEIDKQSEVAKEQCRQIGLALPTRSRADTQETRDLITKLYDRYEATCPNHTHLLPE